MRHLIKNCILVAVSYSLALSSPAYAKNTDNFLVVKNYVNGSGSKNFKSLVEKMEGELPVSLYEQALKNTRGADGKRWFQAAKLANNYIYVRHNNSKIFIRVTEEKAKTVLYANGIKIHEDDFRNPTNVQNKLFLAYLAGLPAKKTSMLDFLNFNSAFAGETAQSAQGTDTPAPVNNQCNNLADTILRSLAQKPPDTQTAKEICNQPQAKECNFPASTCSNITPAVVSGLQKGAGASNFSGPHFAMFMIFAIAMILLASRNKSKNNKPKPTKPPAEVPEPGEGVGRDPVPNPPPGGGVNCGPAGCPGAGTPTAPPGGGTPVTPTPTPETPAPETPEAGNGSDPNYGYGLPLGSPGTNRPAAFKTKKK